MFSNSWIFCDSSVTNLEFFSFSSCNSIFSISLLWISFSSCSIVLWLLRNKILVSENCLFKLSISEIVCFNKFSSVSISFFKEAICFSVSSIVENEEFILSWYEVLYFSASSILKLILRISLDIFSDFSDKLSKSFFSNSILFLMLSSNVSILSISFS